MNTDYIDSMMYLITQAYAKKHSEMIDNYFKECLGEYWSKRILKIPKFITKRILTLEIKDTSEQFSLNKIYTLILFPNIKILRHRFKSLYL